MKSKTLSIAVLGVLALAAVAAVAGYPITHYLPHDVLAALAAAGSVPLAMSGEVTLVEVKKVIEQQGEAFEQFKKANDELLKAKAEGTAVGDLEAKVKSLGDELDKLGDVKEQLEQIEKKLGRPRTDGEVKAEEAFEAERKSFNLSLRSDLQAKGKTLQADMTADEYRQYKSGFFRLATGVPLDHLTADERKAMQAGSDPDGGYLLPAATAGRVVAKVYEQSTMRQLASVQTISTNDIEGIVDNDEASAGWVSELGSRTETNTPQVGKWRIEAFEMYAMPKASQRILDDAATDVEAWLAAKVADKFARVEGAAFWTGTGAGQPRGMTTYTTATTDDSSRAWGQFQYVPSGASGDFTTTKADPLQDLLGAMKDRYLTNANWVMRRAVRTKLRKLKEATSDRYLWEPSLQAGQPDRLLGYPCRIDEYMPALAANSLSLAFGDFREAYQIVDRLGIRTLRDPYTQKPWVLFYSTRRVGGGALNFEAVKFIKFAAS